MFPIVEHIVWGHIFAIRRETMAPSFAYSFWNVHDGTFNDQDSPLEYRCNSL